MRDEALVARICEAVVRAVEVPVTLKIRTGWDATHRNAPAIARIAEDAGIAALAVHGRTRDQQYKGVAEYDTIAQVKSLLSIPVIANGDIDSPQRAAFVLRHTGADAVMIGRAAQGRPWIFGGIAHYLATGELLPPPSLAQVRDILLGHLRALHDFYGEPAGLRIARKHLGWYAKDRPENGPFRAVVNRAETADAQLALTRDYFDALIAGAAPPLPVAALSRESASHRFPDKVDTANRREHDHVEPDHSAPKAGNRRPIAARGNVLVQRFSAWLARTGVSPNLISMISIVFAALGAAALLELGSPWGACLFAIASVLQLLCILCAEIGRAAGREK